MERLNSYSSILHEYASAPGISHSGKAQRSERDGNGGIPAQHTPVNGSREIERGVGYRKYSEELSGYPTIQSAMEGGFSKRVNRF